MKLVKQSAGEYKGQTLIDGLNIELSVSSLDRQGFSFEYRVNGNLVYADGFYGLRLMDIKNGINNNIESIIEEHKEK
jgi:hypothetical protein